MCDENNCEEIQISTNKILNDDERKKLDEQNSRLVPEMKALKLESDAKKFWDLFYKRNETRFFKDRRWTTREFEELISLDTQAHGDENDGKSKVMFEIGCGVGNFFYPLIEENRNDYFIYACDFSPRAIEFVKKNSLYDDKRVKAFQCDITTDTVFEHIKENTLDIVTMIFVLSAIHPNKFKKVLNNIYQLLKPNGLVLFRDYGLYDMAQIRFKAGHKISDNFYMRQDGTRSYYFAEDECRKMFEEVGFEVVENSYIYRRTVNPKENINVERIFLQGKYKKPIQ